jgi:hypothetical protein
MKSIKLKTDVQIKFTKKGNIAKLVSPYDNDNTISQPIFADDEYTMPILSNLFKGFGEAYLMNFNN